MEEEPTLAGLQARVLELTGTIEDLKGEIRDREGFIQGQKETIEQFHKQMEELAMALGVANNFPLIRGEVEKLIKVEDDNDILRRQMKTLKDGTGEEVGKAVVETEKKIKESQEEVINLKEVIKELKMRKKPKKHFKIKWPFKWPHKKKGVKKR